MCELNKKGEHKLPYFEQASLSGLTEMEIFLSLRFHLAG